KNNAAAITDLVAGRGDFAFQALHGILPLVQSGKLRLIASVTDQRTQWTPDLPTLKEQGIGGVEINSWIGAFLPKGAPKEMAEAYSRVFTKVLNQPQIKADLLKDGIVVNVNSPDEMAALMRHDSALWNGVVDRGHIVLRAGE